MALPPPTLDADALERRAPVWSALADLFLDTEVRDGLPRAAVTLLDSGHDERALEAIFLDEVAPVLHWNLKQVAGEWAGFDEAWLREQILLRRRPAATPRWLGGLRRWFGRLRARPALADFEVLLVLVHRARSLDPRERDAWATALGGLVAVYFERPQLDAFLESHQTRLRSSGLSEAQLRELVARDLHPVFARLRVRGVDPDESVGRAQVEAALAATRAAPSPPP